MAMTGLTVPIIAGATLFAVDHVAVSQQVSALQKAADAAAIAAARELHFVQTKRTNSDGDTLSAIAEGYARQNMPGSDLSALARAENDRLVSVELTLNVKSPLGQIFKVDKVLTANAQAEIYGAQNICIIAADRRWRTIGIYMKDNAEIKAGTCGIYSNQPSRESIHVKNSAYIDADFICAAGAYEGGDNNVSTPVNEDCAQIEDPLAGRYFPPAPPCDSSFPRVIEDDETVNLRPGTYCGGLKIKDNASVWFEPGLYYFDNGPLIIEDKATVTGENVGLYFEDKKSWFEFKDDAEIVFSAPTTGPMAGIVVSARDQCLYQNRCDSDREDFLITSANIRSLLGTIYLPMDDLKIDTTMPVSEEAAFTIVIVDNLVLEQSPALVLNTDYAATDVPVPDGFAGLPSTRIVQ